MNIPETDMSDMLDANDRRAEAERTTIALSKKKPKTDWKSLIIGAILGAILMLLMTWLIEILKIHHKAGL